MPNPYRDIWNHNGINAAAQTLTLPQRLQNPPRDACDGTTILTVADANAGGRADFNALFHAYIDYGNKSYPTEVAIGIRAIGLYTPNSRIWRCINLAAKYSGSGTPF